MADESGGTVDARAISRLGRAFDERLKEEMSELQGILTMREGELSRIEARLEAMIDGALANAGELSAQIALVRGERNQIAQDATRQQQELEAIREERTRLEREIERLKLVHQSQVEALFARHREAESNLKERLADAEARLGELGEMCQQVREQAHSFAERARVDLDKAVAAHDAAQAEVAALKRNARAREAMLRENAQEARLQGQVATMHEATRSKQFISQIAVLTEVIRQAGGHGNAHARTAIGLLLDTPFDIDIRPQSVDDAVVWLASYAEPAMGNGVSIAFEVAAGSIWTDETFIAAAFRWVLGRPVDADGREHYRLKLRVRMTRRELLLDLARSEEAARRLYDGSAVRGAGHRNFLMSAYDLLLNRGADTGGLEYYLAKLDAGASRGIVLLDLARSAESRQAATVTGSSLRAIWNANRRQSRANYVLERLLCRRLPGWRHAWQAGRLATLECEIKQMWRGAQEKLEEIEQLIEERVAAARATAASASSALPTPEKGKGGTVQPAAGEAIVPNLLGDCSAHRTVSQVIDLIESELKELGLK